MPPKSRITRQMILNSSIDVVRNKGIANLNVRAIATDLKCSTQPVMYHFATMDELKTEIYTIVAENHFCTLTSSGITDSREPCVELGRRYIRYAVSEPNLFRFLYQTDRFTMDRLSASWEIPELVEILIAISRTHKLDREQTQALFSIVLLSAHGLASFLANNTLTYDEAYADLLLRSAVRGYLSTLEG